MKRGVELCLSVSVSVSAWGEVTVGYARLRGGMGATFCHLAAFRSAIEFLFWDHWETAVLGKSWRGGGHGRSWEVTGGYRHGGGKRRKVEERQEKGRRKP